MPDRLVGDPVRIGQILINLVGNAIKFTGQGEVLVRARAADVHDASVTLEFLVRDTGIGIPPDKQAVIFDAFAQADSSTTRKFGGTGLGLAICRRLSALMNGGLSVQSRPGFGTTFTVTLVCGCDGVELLGPPSVDLAERRPLYVDPNPDCQALVRSATEKSGAIAVFADDVAAARRILRQGRAQFDIVAFDARSLEAAETPEEPTSLRAESAGELVSEIGAAHVIVASAAHRLVRDRRLCEANDWPHAVVKPVTAAGWLRVLAAAALPSSFDDGLDEVRTPMASDSDPLMLLLVEDNPVNQQVATRMLERVGHTVVVAENGREGIDAVMSAREPFDAILMDVQMPVMGGIAATRAIREHEGELARHGLPHRHTPIIAMTARAMQGDRDLCLEAGMDDYVSKPIRPQSLFQALDRLTRDREPRPPVDVTSEQAALPDTLPRGIDTRFDREVALGVFGNDEDLLVHISELIRRNTPPMLARLGQAMADGDFEQVGFQAHTIKGSLSSVGAKRASALAGQIETQANAGDASRFPELFRKLEQAYEEVSAALA
ncbi:MAG: ATP-binding protein [Burkholderiaceae bacterium]